MTTASDGTLKIWNIQTGECTTTVYSENKRGDAPATFSCDSSKFVMDVPRSNTAKIQRSRIGDCCNDMDSPIILKGHEGPISSTVFSPNGLRVATASDDCTVKIWEEETGKHLITLVGHKAEVTSVAFFSDGHRVASGSCDCTAR